MEERVAPVSNDTITVTQPQNSTDKDTLTSTKVKIAVYPKIKSGNICLQKDLININYYPDGFILYHNKVSNFNPEEFNYHFRKLNENLNLAAVPLPQLSIYNTYYYIPKDSVFKWKDVYNVKGNFIWTNTGYIDGALLSYVVIIFNNDINSENFELFKKKYNLKSNPNISIINANLSVYGDDKFTCVETNLIQAEKLIALCKTMRKDSLVKYIQNQIDSNQPTPLN